MDVEVLPPVQVSKRELARFHKQRATHKRIEQAALALFVERGFERTSIDMIAERASISRRTFFHYFPSKEDIIHSEAGEEERMAAAARALVPNLSPLEAAEHILNVIVGEFEKDDAFVIDRITRQTPALMERRHYHYACRERSLLGALLRIWPDPSRLDVLRVTAAAGIGVLRLAVDAWSVHGGELELLPFLSKGFRNLRDGLSGGRAAEERSEGRS
jgi:AcrR family transcriptional regulator